MAVINTSATSRFDKILLYPVRRQAFLPCDKDFGVIKRHFNKLTAIITRSSNCNNIIVKQRNTELERLEVNILQKGSLTNDTFSRNILRNEKIAFCINGLLWHHFRLIQLTVYNP